MRVYGQSLSEVFAVMPWQLKLIVLAGLVWVPFTVVHAFYVYIDLGKQINRPGLTAFANSEGDRTDPSIAEGPDTTLFMVYGTSTNFPDDTAPKGRRWMMQVRIASTKPPCKRWEGHGEVFPATPEALVKPDGSQLGNGTWWVETPTLVYDPDDKGREYKVYATKYFWMHDVPIARQYNAIVYRYSHDPLKEKEGDGWSETQWFFSAKAGEPPSPFGDVIKHHINDLDPSLKDIVLYTRPSAVMLDKTIYMTLSAFTAGQESVDRIVMISSSDHGNTWHYLGTPLTHADAPKVGPYVGLNGVSMIKKEGKLYLAAVFTGREESGLGPVIFALQDPAQAQLRRNPKTGAPLVIKTIPHSTSMENRIGGGYATFADACKGRGLVTSEFSRLKTGFQIFDTLKDPVE
jgi:hypothetical protein